MQWNNSFIKENKITFDITIFEDDRTVWLNRFIIKRKMRQKGIGSQCLELFTKWLDENHYDSKLLVGDCYGIPEEVLIKFYSKYGYTNWYEKNNSIYLIRKCQK